MLEAALSKSRATSVDEFVRKEIFDPLGMSNSALSKQGSVTMLYGDMKSTSTDLAKLGLWVIKALDDQSTVLTSDSVRSMLSKPAIAEWKEPLGHLWWNYESLEAHAAIGDRGNLMVVVPNDELVISKTKASWENYTELPFEHFERSLTILKDALRCDGKRSS